ncbi:MAG TPA: translation initiation factor IF-3 [Candidatus Saccharimonadales bacterium]|nr:translation initiation factor IF-3 [Candidatus Saccharimonadales bacterium]
MAKHTRLNEQIRASRLRVIDEDGKQLGILSKQEALQLADERGLDLVEISPNTDPPVCKIVDWGKFNYQRTKQQQKNRKNTKVLDMKQMRFGLKIGQHDLDIKMNKVRKFLDAGHKVKVTIFYRGREQAHKELGFKLAEKVIADFGDTIVVDQQPQLAGRQLNFVARASGKGPVTYKANQETEEDQEQERNNDAQTEDA